MAFRLLALAIPDLVKTEIKIAYPKRNIMECTLVVIVFSVNAGKVKCDVSTMPFGRIFYALILAASHFLVLYGKLLRNTCRSNNISDTRSFF